MKVSHKVYIRSQWKWFVGRCYHECVWMAFVSVTLSSTYLLHSIGNLSTHHNSITSQDKPSILTLCSKEMQVGIYEFYLSIHWFRYGLFKPLYGLLLFNHWWRYAIVQNVILRLYFNMKLYFDMILNLSLWPSDDIWQHRTGSIGAQVMAWCSHYLS